MAESGPDAMKRLRAERDVSQHQLAVLIGKTAGAISQFERGVNLPRKGTVERIDEALGAQGQVLAAFGYSLSRAVDGEWVSRAQHEALAAEVRRLAKQVETLKTRMKHLPPPSDRASL